MGSVGDTSYTCQRHFLYLSKLLLRQREFHKRMLPRRVGKRRGRDAYSAPSKNTFYTLIGRIPAARTSISSVKSTMSGIETIYCYFVCCMLSLLSFVSISTSSSFTLTSLFYFNVALFLLLRHPVLFLRHPEQSRRVSEHLIRHLELVEISLRCSRDT